MRAEGYQNWGTYSDGGGGIFVSWINVSAHPVGVVNKVILVEIYSFWFLWNCYGAKEIMVKNLSHRKCVRRAIFRNVEVRVEGGGNCVTVRPVRCHLTPKMNIAFFITNLILKFFSLTIFLKKAIFSEKNAKNCFGGAFDNFPGKEGVLRRK